MTLVLAGAVKNTKNVASNDLNRRQEGRSQADFQSFVTDDFHDHFDQLGFVFCHSNLSFFRGGDGISRRTNVKHRGRSGRFRDHPRIPLRSGITHPASGPRSLLIFWGLCSDAV